VVVSVIGSGIDRIDEHERDVIGPGLSSGLNVFQD